MTDPKFIKELIHKLGPGVRLEKPVQVFVEEEDAYVNLSPIHNPQKTMNEQDQVINEQKVIEAKIIEKYDEVSSANNSSTTKDKYQGRVNFKQVYNNFQDAAFDLWYKWPYYGRTNLKGEASKILLDYSGKLDSVEAYNNIVAPMFIIPTLKKIKFEFSRRKLSKSSVFLRKIEFKRGYEDEDQFFNKHLDDLYNVFFSQVLSKHTTSPSIKNIDDFYQIFKHFMMRGEKQLTLPAFFESNKYVPHSSGLVYDVHDGDPTSDEEKIEFYNDANFGVYVYIAKTHGFAIDPNVPWRLVVDLSDDYWRTVKTTTLGSTAINKYFEVTDKKKMNPTTTEELFESFFSPCTNYYNFNSKYNGFVLILNKFYEKFTHPEEGHPRYYVNKSITQKEGFVRLTETNSSKRKSEGILDEYKIPVKLGGVHTIKPTLKVDNKYLNWYLEIRNIEKGRPLTNQKIKILKKQINQIYNFAKLKTTQEFFEFANVAIKYIEFALGTTNANTKKNPIFLLNQIDKPVAKIKIGEKKRLAAVKKDGTIEIVNTAAVGSKPSV